ncbi:MAG: site-specific integrase, partial [Pseudomonadota bacterium]
RLALVRKMYAWGVEADMVPASPVIGVRAPGREDPRRRVLSEAEVAALWRAWDRLGWPFGPMFKLMLLTAQRRSDVAAVRLTDIILPDPQWIVPAEKGRPGREHVVPLSPLALEILASLPRLGSPYVFPARGKPDRHASGFSGAAKRTSDLSGVTDWRTQDLRRTAAAGMAELGTPAHVIDRVLNYTPHGGGAVPITDDPGAYAREKRAALDGWSSRVQDIVGGHDVDGKTPR